ncbi:MAG: hypothetical protein A3G18_11400 [Rhodospirillales bacterium RIFCSPLOWO2_12_FULL_58_28]|nr:MAG: hypothetical protein A3H92_10545 [Rhodospirillales bacterium RIFCSPLOWO2_02_FULL_58_16]OHC77790.1 MAG: hypothetical protein A3G18_11400 [Rhodospirillales bacterium RIFCSPLOWO2_12_FULL_58_28]
MLQHIIPDVVRNQNVQSLSPDDTALQAARTMTENNISAIIVTNGGKLAGIVTERDLTQRIISRGLDPKNTRIKDFMTTGIISISPDDTALDALEIMNKNGYRHLPVLDGDKIIGIVSARDLYAAVKLSLEGDIDETTEYMFGCTRYTN